MSFSICVSSFSKVSFRRTLPSVSKTTLWQSFWYLAFTWSHLDLSASTSASRSLSSMGSTVAGVFLHEVVVLPHELLDHGVLALDLVLHLVQVSGTLLTGQKTTPSRTG
jgi:hypothetical protein